MNRHYILDGHEPVEADITTWASWFKKAERHVDMTNVTDDVTVSTVFLGLDHNYGGEGGPVLFETMVFGGQHDQFCERYETWDQAQAGHDRAVRMVTP